MCILASFLFYAIIQISFDINKAVEKISSQLNISPEGDAIRDYVYCNLLVIGDTQPQVETKLRLIGDFSIYGNYFVKKYRFNNSDFNFLIKELHLTYDRNWRLQEKGFSAGFGDYKKIECNP